MNNTHHKVYSRPHRYPTTIPTTAPTATCRGVCPILSFNCPVVELTGWSGGSSVMIILRTDACFPAWRRTPVASYITYKQTSR